MRTAKRALVVALLTTIAGAALSPAQASAAATFLSKFGTTGTNLGQFDRPRGIDVGPDGRIVIADQFNERIQTVNPDGGGAVAFGTGGAGQDQFSRPSGVAILPGGLLAVSDTLNNRVKIVKTDGTFVRQFGNGADPNPTGDPRGLAYDPFMDDLLIANSSGNSVQRRELDGTFISQVPVPGAIPNAVAVQADGDFVVAEFDLDRVEEFSPAGVSKSIIGTSGNGDGQLNAPTGVDIAPNGDIWVADSANNRIQRFTPGGAFVEKFGLSGVADGEFNTPRTLAVDCRGNVWVTDSMNDRIQRLGEPGTKLPPCDTTAPETTITKKPTKKHRKRSIVRFESSEPGSAFTCLLDGSDGHPCASPQNYADLKPGRHTLSVAATDAEGNTDTSPAETRFFLKKKR
jgi:DNA-binding beta-propeller fold protein YncE